MNFTSSNCVSTSTASENTLRMSDTELILCYIPRAAYDEASMV